MEYDDTRLLAETVRPNDEHTDDLLGSVVGMVERQINWEDYVRNGYTGKPPKPEGIYEFVWTFDPEDMELPPMYHSSTINAK